MSRSKKKKNNYDDFLLLIFYDPIFLVVIFVGVTNLIFQETLFILLANKWFQKFGYKV